MNPDDSKGPYALLDGFKIPVIAAFTDAIYLRRVKNGKPFNEEGAYSFKVGDALHSTPEEYTRTDCRFIKDSFTIQICRAKTGHPDSTLTFKIFRPNFDRTKLQEHETIETTQEKFLRFLKSGDLEQTK